MGRAYRAVVERSMNAAFRWRSDSPLARCGSSVPLGADEIDEREDQPRERNGAEAGPAACVESERPEVRAQRSTDKERDHIEGVDAASRLRREAIDARLVRNVARLHADVDQHNARNQAWQHAAEE